MRKAFILSSFVIAMAAVAASYSFAHGQHQTGSTGSASAAPVTINVWSRWPEMIPSLDSTIASFNKQHSNITVKLTNIGPSQSKAAIQAAISGGNLPDIYYGIYPLQQMVKLDLVHKLNSFFTPALKKKYIPGTWAQGYTTLNGNVYAFPLFAGYHYSYMMFYNPALMKKYGIAQVPKSWSEFIRDGKKIYQESGGNVYGDVQGAKSSWNTTGYVMTMASAISPELFWDSGGVTGINFKTGKYEFDSPGIIDTMNFVKSLQTENILYPNSLSINDQQGKALFEQGKAVFMFDGTYIAGELAKEGMSHWSVALLPTKNGKPTYEGFQGESPAAFLVSAHTKHYPQVEKVLGFMVSHYYRALAENGAGEPPIISAMKGIKEPYPQFPSVMKIQNEVHISTPNPYEANAATIAVISRASSNSPQRQLGDVMDGYWSGQIASPDAALKQLTKEFNTALTGAIAKSNGKVTRSDFVFSNWTPFKPYTAADYQSR